MLARFLIHTLELVMALKFSRLYVETMFPPTLRECALFGKRVLLDHVLAEYGLGYSVVSRHGMSEEEAPASACLPVWQDLCTLRGVSQPRILSTLLTQ